MKKIILTIITAAVIIYVGSLIYLNLFFWNDAAIAEFRYLTDLALFLGGALILFFIIRNEEKKIAQGNDKKLL